MNDLANLFKPAPASDDPIPGLLRMCDGALVTVKVIELTAQENDDQLQQLHDLVLVKADTGLFSWAAERAIEDNQKQRMALEAVLRGVSDYRRQLLNWRVNVAAGQLQTHNASNFPALPQVLADYLQTLSVA